MVADQEPGHGHGDRPADMDRMGDRVPPHDDRQRDQHLDIVLIDRFHAAIADPPDDEAEQRTANRFLEKQHTGSTEGEIRGSGRGCQENREDDDRDSVVEQAFPGNPRLQGWRHMRRFQDPENGDRIGRTDQGAENAAPKKRHIEPDQRPEAHEAQSDDDRGHEDAHRRHSRDRPFALEQQIEIDMERAREQEERQHAIEQRGAEIDAFEKAPHRSSDPDVRRERIDADNGKRGKRPHDGQADRMGQANEPIVHIPQDGRKHDEHGGGIERIERTVIHYRG